MWQATVDKIVTGARIMQAAAVHVQLLSGLPIALALLPPLAAATSIEQEILSLEDAVAFALEANHDQLALIDQVELAELDYANARAAYKTKFMATSRSDVRSGAELGSYSGVYLKKRSVDGSALSAGLYNSDFGDLSLSELRFTYTLPFFQDEFSDGHLSLTRADIEYVRRQHMLGIARQELAQQVTSTYYGLILATDREEMARVQLQIAEKIYASARIKHGAGKVSDVDLGRAELKLMSAQQASEIAVFQREIAEDSLRLLLGFGMDQYLMIDHQPNVNFDDGLLFVPAEVLEESAVHNRIELRGKRDELDMARKKLHNISESKLPQIDIDLHYSLVGEGDSTGDSFKLDDQTWGVGFSMDTDFAGTERKNRRRKLYLIYQSQVRELEHLTKRVRLGVRTAQFDAQRNARELELIAQEHQLAQKQLQQAKILYENDRLNQVELLESENALREAEHRHLAAEVSYVLSTMELALASGQYDSLWRL